MSKNSRKTIVATIAALTLATGMIAVSAPAQAGMHEMNISDGTDGTRPDEGVGDSDLGAIVGVALLGSFLGSLDSTTSDAPAVKPWRPAASHLHATLSIQADMRPVHLAKSK